MCVVLYLINKHRPPHRRHATHGLTPDSLAYGPSQRPHRELPEEVRVAPGGARTEENHATEQEAARGAFLLHCQDSVLGRVGQASPLGKVILLQKESLCAAVSLFASATFMSPPDLLALAHRTRAAHANSAVAGTTGGQTRSQRSTVRS